MSGSMIVNRGTMRSPLVRDTTANVPMDAKMKNLQGLIMKTSGISQGALMTGVMTRTVPAGMKDRPELTKVPKDMIGKTKSKKLGQVPFGGPKY